MEASEPPAVESIGVVETQRRGRLAEYAYEYTKRQLFDGTLRPGQKVRVEEVVSRLNTSRQPVMDAFKRLAGEGYLEIIPQVGCRVVVPARAEIADFFLIFAAVAGMAADLAAARRTAGELADIELTARRIAALAAPSADRSAVGAAYAALNREFHEQIRSMAHSETVAQLGAGLADRSDFYLASLANGTKRSVERLLAAPDRHARIVAAIAVRDAETARALTEAQVHETLAPPEPTLPEPSLA